MRLTPEQLRRMIVQETRRTLREANVGALSDPFATVKAAPVRQAGNMTAEEVVHEFFHKLYPKFGGFIDAIKRGYQKWGYGVEAEAKPTQRSGTNERLLRAYVRVLLEETGDENDFNMQYPDIMKLKTILETEKELWEKSYEDVRKDWKPEKYNEERLDWRKKIDEVLVKHKLRQTSDFNTFVDNVNTQVKDVLPLAEPHFGKKQETAVNDFMSDWQAATGALVELNKMGPDKGTGFADDPRISVGSGYLEDAPSHLSPLKQPQQSPPPSSSGAMTRRPGFGGSQGPTRRSP